VRQTPVYLSLDLRLVSIMIVSLPIESNVVDDADLTDLEEVFDPPSTSLPFVVPSLSSTPMDTTASDLILLFSPLPLS